MQLSRVVAQAGEREARQRLDLAAFVGWQHYLLQPLDKGRKHMDFARYRRSIGLDGGKQAVPELSEEEKAVLNAKARQNEARVIDLFRRRKPT